MLGNPPRIMHQRVITNGTVHPHHRCSSILPHLARMVAGLHPITRWMDLVSLLGMAHLQQRKVIVISNLSSYKIFWVVLL